MPLNTIVPGRIWHAQQPVRFGPIRLTTRMTVVRLESGALWIHSPVTPTSDLCASLQELGRPGFVVAPNKSHHLFFKAFLAAYPAAQGYVAPGLKEKRSDLADFRELAGPMPWDEDLAPYLVRGLPILNETVWFHHSSRTLIVTDLLFSFSGDGPTLTRVVAKGLGVLENLGMSRTMKLAVRDRGALSDSIRPLLELPVERIVLAHDQVVTGQARSRLQRAFEWLR